jgi:hypothetical protein
MHRRTNTGEDIFIQATELKYLYVRNLDGIPSYFFIKPLRPHPPPTLIKNKIKLPSYIRKFRRKQLPSHTVYEEGLPNI